MKFWFLLILFSFYFKISLENVIKTKLNDQIWWQSAIFYKIFVPSFKDSNGDGIGDIGGIITKLDYFKEIHVNGLILSSIFKSSPRNYDNDVEDFFEIDSLFGGNDALKKLISKAHEIKIKIILTFIPNHTSINHKWFSLSSENNETYADYYIWHEGKIINGTPFPPNNWLTEYSQPAWTWHPKRNSFYYHKFMNNKPDLNFRNDLVQNEFKKIFEFWIKFGVDGFKFNDVNYLFEDKNFKDNPDGGSDDIYTNNLQESYNQIKIWRDTFFGKLNKVVITETKTNLNLTNKWYGSENESISDIPINFLFISEINKNSTAKEVKEKIQERLKKLPKGKFMNWILGTEDFSRIMNRMNKFNQLNFLYNILLLTLPGVPIIYYGDEIRMENNRFITWEQTKDPLACILGDNITYKKYSRDAFRTPFQWDSTENAGFSNTTEQTWLPIDKNYININLKDEKDFEISHFSLIKNLIEIRQGNEEFISGDFYSYTLRRLFVFLRGVQSDRFYGVAINFGEYPDAIDLNDVRTLKKMNKPKAHIRLSKYQHGLIYRAEELHIPPFESIVFEVKSLGIEAKFNRKYLILSLICVIYYINLK